MIKLLDILREAVMPQNKMIIMAGSAGAGKSTLINKIKSNVPGFEVINPDRYVEDKDSPMYNNLAQSSIQVDDKDVPDAIAAKKAFIWDTTASNSAKLFGGTYKRKEVPGLLNTIEGYNVLMIMVYAHPIVSFLRNFARERRVPKIGVISTWNSVYGNIDTYKSKLGDNFIMYESSNNEYEQQIKEFNEAVTQGRLYDWLEELTSKNPDQFKSTLGNKAPEPTTPEEQAKKDKAKEKSTEAYKLQVEQLEKEFLNINDKIKDFVLTEQEIINKVKEFSRI
jgi:predicted kinase